MNTRTKLIIGFSSITILILLVIASTGNTYATIRQHLNTLSEGVVPAVLRMSEIETEAGVASRAAKEYVATGLTESKETAMSAIDRLSKLGMQNFNYTFENGSEDIEAARDLVTKLDTLILATTGFIRQKDMQADRATLFMIENQQVNPALNDLLELAQKQKTIFTQEMAEAEAAVNAAETTGIRLLLISAFLVMLLAIAVTFFIARSIVRPLDALRQGTEIIGKGNLDYSVGTNARDEIGQLSRAFDQMTRDLKKTTISIDTLNKEITERQRIAEKLRESEEKYRAIFEQASDSIVLIDTSNEAFVDFNDRAHENLGYTREELARLKVTDIDVMESYEETVQHLKKTYGGGTEVFETKQRTKNGDIRDILVSIKMLNISGKIFSLAVWHDITERKRAEEKIKQALANLENSNTQLAAVNKELEAFSYSVSHDLRTPLRTIDGFSQALLEDYLDNLDEQGQDYLRRVRAASQRMGILIDDLLKLSRLSRSEMHQEQVDLSTLAEEIAAELQQTQPERHVEFVISHGLTANGDRQLLKIALENLLGNAWKFTGKRQQARIEVGITRNGGKKTYFVRDNGAGFDMNYADKLFGAFQRLHDTADFPGIGIGLATTQRIIHRHGGNIRAEGAVGEGATFYFTLN
jgi:PAS domain S-box-containing protein